MQKQKFKINWFTGKKDNEVKLTEDITWEQLCETLGTHTITETKNDLGFILAEFKTENYRPAEKGIYDGYGDDAVKIGFDIKYDENGKEVIGRYAENIVAYNCLVFDYDGNGVDLNERREAFKGLKHLGYTSHNHIISGMHKFRIIIPFETPCPINDWFLREEAFRQFGGVDDRSTTAKARIFFAPTCPVAGANYATTWHEDGILLDWSIFAPKQQVVHTQQLSVAPMSPTGTGKVRWETFDMVRFFKDRGLYVAGCAPKHDVRCFRQSEHNTNSAGGVVVWQKPGDWPSFYCGHSHNLHSKDFWEFYKTDRKEMEKYCLREEVEETPTMKMMRQKLNKIRGLT